MQTESEKQLICSNLMLQAHAMHCVSANNQQHLLGIELLRMKNQSLALNRKQSNLGVSYPNRKANNSSQPCPLQISIKQAI